MESVSKCDEYDVEEESSSSSVSEDCGANEGYAIENEDYSGVSLTNWRQFFYASVLLLMISNSNRTEWSPVRSVIIRVITKLDHRATGVRFVHHEYDYRPNWTTRSLISINHTKLPEKGK